MLLNHEAENQLIRAEHSCYETLKKSNEYISQAMSKLPQPRGNTLIKTTPYHGMELMIKAGRSRILKNKNTGERTEIQSLDLIVSPVAELYKKGYWLRLISNTLFGDTFHVFRDGQYLGEMLELGLKPVYQGKRWA